jgi:MFS superfamily sulfate permease-like transporter
MLHLEFLADYFSEPLVGGFLFGATFHILVQQLDAAIGVKKPKSSGLGHFFIVSFLELLCGVIFM